MPKENGKMKKICKSILVFMSILLILSASGCADTHNGDGVIGTDKRVEKAVEVLTDCWSEQYDDYGTKDKYLKIINTKVINIKDNIDGEKIFNQDDLFKDVEYIVEFELLSNYFDTMRVSYDKLWRLMKTNKNE